MGVKEENSHESHNNTNHNFDTKREVTRGFDKRIRRNHLVWEVGKMYTQPLICRKSYKVLLSVPAVFIVSHYPHANNQISANAHISVSVIYILNSRVTFIICAPV